MIATAAGIFGTNAGFGLAFEFCLVLGTAFFGGGAFGVTIKTLLTVQAT